MQFEVSTYAGKEIEIVSEYDYHLGVTFQFQTTFCFTKNRLHVLEMTAQRPVLEEFIIRSWKLFENFEGKLAPHDKIVTKLVLFCIDKLLLHFSAKDRANV